MGRRGPADRAGKTGRRHRWGVDDVGAGGRLTLRARVRPRDLVVCTRQFSSMISAGLPLTQTLDILSRQGANPALRDVIREALYDVEAGNTLSQALGRHPAVFTDLYVNMVAAGESGSRLDEVLGRLATFVEKTDRVHRKVKSALIYPTIVLAVAVLVIATLLLFVIPTFETVFDSYGALLPLPTRAVIAFSRAVQSWWWVMLGATGVAVVLFRRWAAGRGRPHLDRFLLRLPVFGSLLRRAAVSRFTRTLSTMLSSGVPILDGLQVTARTAGNVVVHDAVLKSRDAIAGGDSIAAPLEATGVFPPMVTRMIHVGEETGDLDGMLSRIADFYDDEVDVAVEGVLRILEPALIVVLGGLVGGMIVAMYLPIFDLVNAIQ